MVVNAKRAISGLLLFDKSAGASSNHALQKVKRLFRAEKAGHTGTLDPFATGLLPICFGEATKFSSFGLDGDKSYLATLKLGVTTTTGDTEGEIVAQHEVTTSQADVDAVLPRFMGTTQQIPPIYSALKVAGKPMYDYARKGLDVAREAREITISELKCLHFAADELEISVTCGKGTYIRVLAEDIGAVLGCGAHLSALRRTAVASLSIAQALTLAQLESLSEAGRDLLLMPNDRLLEALQSIYLETPAITRLQQGQALQAHPNWLPGTVRIYTVDNEFIGLGEITLDGRLIAKRLIAQ